MSAIAVQRLKDFLARQAKRRERERARRKRERGERKPIDHEKRQQQFEARLVLGEHSSFEDELEAELADGA